MSLQKSNHMSQENASEKFICFVCGQEITTRPVTYNKRLNLPVCEACRQTEAEKKTESKAFESLGEDFVCGCI